MKPTEVNHRRVLSPKNEAHLFKAFGVDADNVQFVCTTTVTAHSTNAVDIFYRKEATDKYSVGYFGIGFVVDSTTIAAAQSEIELPPKATIVAIDTDLLEDYSFAAGVKDGKWVYSKHAHDYVEVDGGTIDGGRSLPKFNGSPNPMANFVVSKGQFIMQENGNA